MTITSVARVNAALATRPRIPLATLPTPLHEATRLRDALGGEKACPRILIKRDDLTALPRRQQGKVLNTVAARAQGRPR
jgi:hypothetical protein